jgi:hypothetical protein
MYFYKIGHWDLTGNSNLINDTRTIIRFNLLLLPFSQSFFLFHNIFANFLSFTGLCFLYQCFCKVRNGNNGIAFIAAFCIPSVFFWSSGVLKEALLFFFLGMSIYSMLLIGERKFNYFLMLFIGLFGLLLSKFYLALIIIPPILLYLTLQLSRINAWQIIRASTLFLLIIIFYQSNVEHSMLSSLAEKQKQFVNVARGGYYFEWKRNQTIDTLYISENCSQKLKASDRIYTIQESCEANYYQHLQMGKLFMISENTKLTLIQHLTPAKSYIYLPVLENSLLSILKILPFACYNVLFLPTIFDIKNLMYVMPALENFVLCLLFLLLILKGRSGVKMKDSFSLFSLLFIFLLILIVGITTPILGAIVRYKIPMLPFLFYFLLTQIKDLLPFQQLKDTPKS